MRLPTLLSSFRPESWGREEDWAAFAARLWREEHDYLAALGASMVKSGTEWLGDPVPIHDGVVQDGHHRIIVALSLGFFDMDIPLLYLPPGS